MGFRFRRTIKVLPGIRLNLSRSGISTSVGVRGAHVTVGHGQVRETVGLPGTGMYYTESQSTRQALIEGAGEAEAPGAPMAPPRWTFGRVLRWLLLVVFLAWVASVAILWALATFLH